jgi:hypothetical protein
MNIIPCTREFYVVYAVEDEHGQFVDLVEDPVVAWEINNGVLQPIPADQLFADDNYNAIRFGDVYYGEFGSGLTRDDILKYFNAKRNRHKERELNLKKPA